MNQVRLATKIILDMVEKGELNIHAPFKGYAEAIELASNFSINRQAAYNARASLIKALPTNGLVKLAKKRKNKRSSAQHERAFCDELRMFLNYILPLDYPKQFERTHGLAFGTQTLMSYTKTEKLALDNFAVMHALYDYCREINMVVGNLVDRKKADNKVNDWLHLYDFDKKMTSVEAGPVTPKALEKEVIRHFAVKERNSLLVVIMDSGGYKNYTKILKDLSNQYPNTLYIIKMIKIANFFKILCARRGELKVVDRSKIKLVRSSWKTRAIIEARIAGAADDVWETGPEF